MCGQRTTEKVIVAFVSTSRKEQVTGFVWLSKHSWKYY